MSMIYDYDSVNLNLCLWFQPAQVGLFQQVVGQHLLAWPGLSQEAYKWLIQNPFQCHPMAEELVIILRTSPHPIWSYPYLSVGYGWIWNILSTSNNDIIVKISPVARWIRLESPRVHRSAFRNIMVKSFPWTKPCVAMKFTGYYSLQPSKLLDPRSTQIYTDLHRRCRDRRGSCSLANAHQKAPYPEPSRHDARRHWDGRQPWLSLAKRLKVERFTERKVVKSHEFAKLFDSLLRFTQIISNSDEFSWFH